MLYTDSAFQSRRINPNKKNFLYAPILLFLVFTDRLFQTWSYLIFI